jgi:predicted transcriptional regulator
MVSTDMMHAMPNDWILDVLEDLRVFARQNGLSATEAEMERAIAVAREELEGGARAAALPFHRGR